MAKKRDIYNMSNGQPVTDGSVSQLCGVLDKPGLVWWAAKEACKDVAAQWKPGTPYEKQYIETVLAGAQKAHARKKDTAGDIGTRVHQIVGAYVEGQLLPEHIDDARERRSLENFMKVTQGWEWLGSEITVINEWWECGGCLPGMDCCSDSPDGCPQRKLCGYGGTADALARRNGKIILPDFKTSNSVQATYSMQCALYAEATPVGGSAHLADLWREITEAAILHFDKELLTWEVLERSIKEHVPYIQHFIGCRRWVKKFEQSSYSDYQKKPVEITADSISVPSSAPQVVVASPRAPAAVWMG